MLNLQQFISSIQIELFNIMDVLSKNWHFGFISFGGPPVHFQLYHKQFVEKHNWIDEKLFQEIFALSQALPGPASTKMLFCINYIHGGILAGFTSFLLWSLPGALGMFALALGVSKIGSTLPEPVYALLSGLNAATVGIIALAAVQLSEKAITDKITRALVFSTGAAGILYTALWFFPALMIAAGIATVIWDYRWLHRLISPLRRKVKAYRRPNQENFTARRNSDVETTAGELAMAPTASGNDTNSPLHIRNSILLDERDIGLEAIKEAESTSLPGTRQSPTENTSPERTAPSRIQFNVLSWQTGVYITAGFLLTFISVLVIRASLKSPPRGVALFANLYLAGTIIFGGGPVVIPLLREYIVAEGWVSSRDFLLGLALIQSFPGPNFNIAVYLGALTAAGTSLSPGMGALIGFLGIFTPGMVIAIAVMGLWKSHRERRLLISLLRGVNAGAVGLVFTAVYKLWQIGFVDVDHSEGSPLGGDPWWVVITATSFVGGAWFGLSAPFAILLGGLMGIIWYGFTKP
ncbi:hypothetical protein G7Y89_g397 [Cudoniella acicularis]|uniref:Chromate transporter n=1 Tax=Cudoniella acicularis TaxID=354080 RepID=A0A8H4RYU8_9HELO|nr:hypothetical protein G7Y89_g397 [Cudoniella acicularis]